MMKLMTKMVTCLLVAFAFTFGMSVALAQSETNKIAFIVHDMSKLDNLQKLAKGYTINYQVIEDRDEPCQLIVTDSGEILVPYYGLVKAAGKTCQELAYDVKKVLEASHYKRATVLIGIFAIDYKNTGTITVMGNVKKPGLQTLLAGESNTVLMAVTEAGGASDFADLRRVRLTRVMEDGETRTFTINLKKVMEEGATDEDMDLLPGDKIFVPKSMFR